MTTNYFKVTTHAKSDFVFFDDRDEDEAVDAFAHATELAGAANVRAKLSVYRRPLAKGAWNHVPVVGGF